MNKPATGIHLNFLMIKAAATAKEFVSLAAILIQFNMAI